MGKFFDWLQERIKHWIKLFTPIIKRIRVNCILLLVIDVFS